MPEQNVISLRHILWARPIVINDQAQSVKISLNPEETGVLFEVTTDDAIIHAQGKLVYTPQTHAELHILDMPAIQHRCNYQQPQTELYAAFDAIGLHYGTSFQVIKTLWHNEQEALAEIHLPEIRKDDAREFVLHPSLIDGSLQAVMGLINHAKPMPLYLPFSLEQLDIINQPLPATCFAYVTLGEAKGELIQFNIQISDEAGKVLVNIKDFAVHAIKEEAEEKAEEKAHLHYYQPVWQPTSLPAIKAPILNGPCLVFDDEGHFLKTLQQKFPQETFIGVRAGKTFGAVDQQHYQLNKVKEEDYVHLLHQLKKQNIQPKLILYRHNSSTVDDFASDRWITKQLQQDYYPLFYLSQALIREKPKEEIKLFSLYEDKQLFAKALTGFAKTLHLEQPKIQYRVIEMPALDANSVDMLVQELNANESEVHYANHQRLIKTYEEIKAEGSNDRLLKTNGVYLITGGTGGLGFIFARYLAEHYQAKLILTGRSALNDKLKSMVMELEKLGATVLYVSADVAKKEDVKRLFTEIKTRFGTLNGVIHSAGILRDAFILKKTPQQLAEVLAPKIYGTVHLDAATQDMPLDFFILFSSIASIFGNVGQCDYAYANDFMNAFAKEREEKRKHNQRQGKTISINWPLWSAGGMQIDAGSLQWMKQTLGATPLETEEGIQAFIDLLTQDSDQPIVIFGEEKKLNVVLQQKPRAHKQAIKMQVNQTVLREKTEHYLKKLLAETLKMTPDRLLAHEPLEKYGIDSVMIMNLNRQLEQAFGELPKTLFFEYQSLSALTDYFIENHAAALAKKLALKSEKTLPSTISPPALPSIMAKRFIGSAKAQSMVIEKEDIAIIGISGRYPQANDLITFWKNLQAGKDCIEDIPKNRWNYEKYFDPDKEKTGKSYSKWGGFIEGVDQFDPLFFNISPREAERMDPQERLFLETAWHTLEDAGYTREALADKQVGVFVGVMYGEYQLFGNEESLKGHAMATSSSYASIANRVSYFCNFHGPSLHWIRCVHHRSLLFI